MAKRTKPNFLIVGVQKAGTTFLAKHLSDHEDVFFARPKELFFFNTRKINKSDFLLYSTENFADAGQANWIGEGSTNYFHHGQAIDHIERYLGNKIPIIVCLRHPVERLFSHYLHDYRRDRRTGSETLDDAAWKGYLSRSRYAKKLELWQERFPRFLPLFFDDLVSDGANFYNQATEFLGIVAQPITDALVNEGLRMVWEDDVLTTSKPPKNGQHAPRFQRQEVEDLVASFAGDVRETMNLTGRDLSAWLEMPDFGQIEQKFTDRQG